MRKRRVGVTLRKPSPAPEGNTAPTAASEPIASAASVESETWEASQKLNQMARQGQVESQVDEASQAPTAGRSQSEIRELNPVEATTIDAFVSGAAAALEKAASQIPGARLRALIERGHEGYRELVLYLPDKLAQALALHCAKHNLDMSGVVTRAIEAHLGGLGGAPRPGADGAPWRGGRAPRELLRELAEWVRALWAALAKWAQRPAADADASG